MAGDWIKMRTDLGTSPKVVRMASALKADRFRIVGGLHSAWSLFDSHSADGKMAGYTLDVLDELIGWPGFAAAMVAVEWLDASDPESLVLPEFDTHNGAPAKRRAQDADRKRRDRKESADKADGKRTRGEERRGESSTPEGSLQEPGALPPVVGNFEGHDDPRPPAPNPAAPLAIALNGAGFRCTSLTPTIAEAASEGVTPEHLLEIAAWPECVGKPASYLIAIARREIAEGRNPAGNGVHHAARNHGSRLSPAEQVQANILARFSAGDDDWSEDRGAIESTAVRVSR